LQSLSAASTNLGSIFFLWKLTRSSKILEAKPRDNGYLSGFHGLCYAEADGEVRTKGETGQPSKSNDIYDSQMQELLLPRIFVFPLYQYNCIRFQELTQLVKTTHNEA
jgi:hypothetical protein